MASGGKSRVTSSPGRGQSIRSDGTSIRCRLPTQTDKERLLPRRRSSQIRPRMWLIASVTAACRRICSCRIRNATHSPTRARAIVRIR